MHWGDQVMMELSRRGGLVLGIDPVVAHTPFALESGLGHFVERLTEVLLEACEDKVGFVKFQSAYFEAFGAQGLVGLARSIAMAKARGFAVILDAKRGDIGSTMEAYARAYLTSAAEGGSDLEVDCMTVNPFLGPETLEPVFDRSRRYGKGVLVLAKTSNPGSGWLQDRTVEGATVSARIAELTARAAAETLGQSGVAAVGAVVGATFAAEARELRSLMPRSVFLAPGLGTQGADPAALAALRTPTGPVLAPISRGISQVEDRAMSIREYRWVVRERIARYASQLEPAPS